MSYKARPSTFVAEDGLARCFWCRGNDDYIAYHDTEWGLPVHDDRRLYEKLCLEGFQSGLSWLTILRKRAGFRRAFEDFDPERVARFDQRKIEALVLDPAIIRHRGKICAAVNNAARVLEIQEELGSFSEFIWSYQPGQSSRPERMTRATLMRMTTCAESVALSKELKRRGFQYVGPTTAYAFMQSMGLVDDHMDDCQVRAAI